METKFKENEESERVRVTKFKENKESERKTHFSHVLYQWGKGLKPRGF